MKRALLMDGEELSFWDGDKDSVDNCLRLERSVAVPYQQSRRIGERLVCILGQRGSGKTAVARRLEQRGKSVRVPVLTTRAIRPDEARYRATTGVEEIVSIRPGDFERLSDLISVRFFNNTFYGLRLSDVCRALETAESLGPEAAILVASGGLRDAVRLRELFPLSKVAYLSVGEAIRQKRLDVDSTRPSDQRTAKESSEDLVERASKGLADIDIDNESALDRTVESFERLFTDMAALSDARLLSHERRAQIVDILRLEATNGIKFALWGGFAVALYTKSRPITDIDFIVQDAAQVSAVLGSRLVEDEGERKTEPVPGYEIVGPLVYEDRATQQLYRLALTTAMLERRSIVDIRGVDLPLMCPDDLVMFKAVFQRGRDRGKYDREDILALAKHCDLDLDYIRRMAAAFGVEDRVMPYLTEVLRAIPRYVEGSRS